MIARLKQARRVPGVLAAFAHVDAAVDAIRALRAKGFRKLVVYPSLLRTVRAKWNKTFGTA